MNQRQTVVVIIKGLTVLASAMVGVGFIGIFIAASTPTGSPIARFFGHLTFPAFVVAVVGAIILRIMRGRNRVSSTVIKAAIVIAILAAICVVVFIYSLNQWAKQ